MYFRNVLLLLLMTVFVGACVSGPGMRSSANPPTLLTESLTDSGCRVAPVDGDTRGVATGPHSLLIVGQGIGLLRSEDDGRHFETLEFDRNAHWPSITFGHGRAGISWIQLNEGSSTAVVAILEQELDPPVEVFSSTRQLIDTEIMVRSNGEILLMVSEVEGPPNCNRASYRIHCFASSDGGRSWAERSRAVSGPWGINIEDPRLVELEDGRVLLAYEWEMEEGGASRILIQYSDDGGRSWSAPTPLWDGRPEDREPGGFYRRNGLLYFVASTDRGSQRSYAGARLAILVSADGGSSWDRPLMPITDIDQLSMGAVALQDRILMLSLRFYSSRHTALYLYPLDPLGLWILPCGEEIKIR